jgi:predicted transcriptional regulator
MRALSIRQPHAERILHGTKTAEYRSRPTGVRERVYIYASLTPATPAGAALPRGVLVGTVEIVGCSGSKENYTWHLKHPRRFASPKKPKRKPQPVWFNPY